jgi:hypothetical protein
MPSATCQLGGMFSKCKTEARQTCQYCGRWFCEFHSYYEKDHEAVCSNKKCRAKIDDMLVHTQYKAGVQKNNKMGLCGIDACGPSTVAQCSLCRGRFCEEHVTFRMYPPGRGEGGRDRALSVCDACWARRKIWR